MIFKLEFYSFVRLVAESLTKELDSYASDQQPMRQQPSITQNCWPFTTCKSSFYYSAPEGTL